MAQNVKFIKGDTAKINGTAITDGQLLYNTTTGQHYIDSGSTRIEVGKPVDSALSTTSTNAISNKAITNSIINTMAEVSAITEPNIPCGTLAVKELNSNLLKCTSTHVAIYIGVNPKSYGTAVVDITNLNIDNIMGISVSENTYGLITKLNYGLSSNTGIALTVDNYTDSAFYGDIYPYVTILHN